MKKLVFALGLTVVVLTGVVAWLAHELRVERAARSAAADKPAVAAVPATSPVPLMKAPLPPQPPVASANAPPTADESRFQPAMFPANKAEQQALARDRLRQLTDPAQRAALAVDSKSSLRRTYIDLAKKVGLTPDEESRFLDLLVEQQLKIGEAIGRCQAEPGCDVKSALGNPQMSLQQEQIDFMGQERFDRFTRYQDVLQERREAYELRKRLPDGQGISDSQAEQLIDSIAAERRKFADEAKERGDEVAMVFTSGSAYAAVAQGDPDRYAHKLESAVEFGRRVHDRAAEVLTPAQLEAFDGIQSEALAAMRNNIRNEQVISSVRNATGTR